MKTKLIGCLSTKNEVAYLTSSLPIDYEFLDFNLHGFPEKLHKHLQSRINASQEYDQIILTYSRCSNMLVGLRSQSAALIVPRTHDCISLLLGSDERRQALSKKNLGTYYFSPGWLDYGRDPYQEYQEYLAKFGLKRADFLIRTLYGRYSEAVFINTYGSRDTDKYRERVWKIAAFFNWKVREVKGNLGLLRDIVNRRINSASLYVPPGKEITLEDILGGTLCRSI